MTEGPQSRPTPPVAGALGSDATARLFDPAGEFSAQDLAGMLSAADDRAGLIARR